MNNIATLKLQKYVSSSKYNNFKSDVNLISEWRKYKTSIQSLVLRRCYQKEAALKMLHFTPMRVNSRRQCGQSRNMRIDAH